jgi:hypothetical protein
VQDRAAKTTVTIVAIVTDALRLWLRGSPGNPLADVRTQIEKHAARRIRRS